MKCPHCNEEHPGDFKYCPSTGLEIKPQLLTCPNCKKTNLPLNYKCCPYCGEILSSITNQDFEHSEHNKVDLGLSICWADCNVGASSPEEFGDYYAWGETEIKNDVYTCENYKFNYGDLEHPEYEYIGDDISESEYDAARVKWGDDWRMPTKDEFEELFRECIWKMVLYKGVKGCRVTGPNGNSIFLPGAGCNWKGRLDDVEDIDYTKSHDVCYWSATLNEEGDNYEAHYMEYYERGWSCNSILREIGHPIRPVANK